MTLPRAYKSWPFHLAWLLAISFVVGIGAIEPSLVRRAQNQVFDFYQRLQPRVFKADLPVKVIDIDDASIARFGQWPWPRSRIAELVDRLKQAKVAAIGFDMVFSERDRTSIEDFLATLPAGFRRYAIRAALGPVEDSDARLARAIADAPVVLGAILTQSGSLPTFEVPFGFAVAGDDPRRFVPNFSGAVVPLRAFDDAAHGLGAVNWLPDDDQIVRRVPLVLAAGGRLMPSLAMETVRVAQDASTYVVRASAASGDTRVAPGVQSVRVGAINAESAADGAVSLHFTPHRQERFISAGSLLDGSSRAADLEGAIAVVGSSAPGLVDIRATPVDAAMPGVEIQAQAIETVLSGTQLIRPNWAAPELIGGALLATGLALVLPLVPALAAAALALSLLAAIVAASWWAFAAHNLLLDPLMPGIMLIATYLAVMSSLFRAEQRDRRFVQGAFGRFVSPAVVSRLTQEPRLLALGGEQRELTVMFTDIRNFSSIAERMSATTLTRFMNRYLSPMSEIVLRFGGTLDKYIGDAVMAFWNAPLPDAAHAEHALRAALAMLDDLPRLQSQLADGDTSFPPVRCGIGLASGPCVVGNLGSTLRFDYSALGDDVNLASRLEGLTKVYGVSILATEATRELAPHFAWLEVETVVVAGRTTPTIIATVVGDQAVAQSDAFRALAEAHGTTLASFRSGDHRSTLALIALTRAIAPASLHALYDHYAARCQEALDDDLPWTQVRQLLHK